LIITNFDFGCKHAVASMDPYSSIYPTENHFFSSHIAAFISFCDSIVSVRANAPLFICISVICIRISKLPYPPAPFYTSDDLSQPDSHSRSSPPPQCSALFQALTADGPTRTDQSFHRRWFNEDRQLWSAVTLLHRALVHTYSPFWAAGVP
jgi:hypothetical protein